MGLPCVNCKQPVEPESVKLFAQVMLCSSCNAIAERFYARGEQELQMLLVVLKESIRLAAIKGELQFSLEQLEHTPNVDLIALLSKLASEVRNEAKPDVTS